MVLLPETNPCAGTTQLYRCTIGRKLRTRVFRYTSDTLVVMGYFLAYKDSGGILLINQSLRFFFFLRGDQLAHTNCTL